MTRIVHCPGCKVLLVEPTAGIAIYQCGNCFKVLYAKHAIQASLNAQQEQLLHNQQQQQQCEDASSKDPSPPPPVPPQLYIPRRQGDVDRAPSSVPSTYSSSSSPVEHANGKRLYTPGPRHANGAESPQQPFLQDMRKLARDAFPAKQAEVQEVSGFDFHKQLSTYKQQADDGGSDYHSTLEELDSSSRRSGVSDYYSSSARVEYEDKQVFTPSKHEEPPGRLAVSHHQQHHHGNGSAFSSTSSVDSDFSPLRDRQPHNSESSSFREEQQKHSNQQSTSGSSSHKKYPSLESPYVWCQHCKMLLEVPCNLPPCNSSVQKLRCGACHRVSRFAVENSGNNFNLTSSSSTPTPSAKTRDGMLQLDIMTSTSPGRGSAPGSFHHVPQQASRCFASGADGKGYDSAPEFQTSYSAASHNEQRSSSIHHARSESGTSSTNGRSLPMAPCLHELFGYDSPSQFLHKHQPPAGKHKVNRSGGKGIKGLILRSIHDIGKLNPAEPCNNVTINGNIIPEEEVRRAEKQAGNIYPGSFWYDYRAGFWGVMGGPCLGIIPPCIPEFNYPMELTCAGGKTGVVVNGRELHQQDMEVLVKRGLPSTPNISYTVDIDGTVIDTSSENQVVRLGRLAPSIEKRGMGFGMYPLTS